MLIIICVVNSVAVCPPSPHHSFPIPATVYQHMEQVSQHKECCGSVITGETKLDAHEAHGTIGRRNTEEARANDGRQRERERRGGGGGEGMMVG